MVCRSPHTPAAPFLPDHSIGWGTSAESTRTQWGERGRKEEGEEKEEGRWEEAEASKNRNFLRKFQGKRRFFAWPLAATTNYHLAFRGKTIPQNHEIFRPFLRRTASHTSALEERGRRKKETEICTTFAGNSIFCYTREKNAFKTVPIICRWGKNIIKTVDCQPEIPYFGQSRCWLANFEKWAGLGGHASFGSRPVEGLPKCGSPDFKTMYNFSGVACTTWSWQRVCSSTPCSPRKGCLHMSVSDEGSTSKYSK